MKCNNRVPFDYVIPIKDIYIFLDQTDFCFKLRIFCNHFPILFMNSKIYIKLQFSVKMLHCTRVKFYREIYIFFCLCGPTIITKVSTLIYFAAQRVLSVLKILCHALSHLTSGADMCRVLLGAEPTASVLWYVPHWTRSAISASVKTKNTCCDQNNPL